jgi:hypothetical protein
MWKVGDWVIPKSIPKRMKKYLRGTPRDYAGKIAAAGSWDEGDRFYVVTFAGYPVGTFHANELREFTGDPAPGSLRIWKTSKRKNPPSDDRVVVREGSDGFDIHYLIRGDTAPDELNRVAHTPTREAAIVLARKLHGETGAAVVEKNPVARAE